MIHRDWENKKLVRRVRVNVNRTPKRRYFTNVYFSIRRLNVCESKHAHVCVKFTTLDEWFIVFWHWSVPFLICCVWWTSKRGSWLREACWCKVSAKSSKKNKKTPYAEIAHSHRSTATSCCVSGMKNLYTGILLRSCKQRWETLLTLAKSFVLHLASLIFTITDVYSERGAKLRIKRSSGHEDKQKFTLLLRIRKITHDMHPALFIFREHAAVLLNRE